MADYVHLMKLNSYGALKLDWVDRFWGDFAWLNLPLPAWIYSWLRWATLAVIVMDGSSPAVHPERVGQGSGRGLCHPFRVDRADGRPLPRGALRDPGLRSATLSG